MALVLLGAWARRRRRGDAGEDGGIEPATLHCGALVIDTAACTVTLYDRPIDLTPKMYELVLFLARRPGATFSDADLLAALWTDSPYAASGDVKQCVYMVRQRFGAVHADPKRLIVNVKGFGYRLVPPKADDELRDG
jgi:DNA-binding response OmpR family regulator